jgi:hypothetical protein
METYSRIGLVRSYRNLQSYWTHRLSLHLNDWSGWSWCSGFVLQKHHRVTCLHSFRVYFHIFSTRFECIFLSSPLVSSVNFSYTYDDLLLLPERISFHSDGVSLASRITKNIRLQVKLHSKRVGKTSNYTRNEWRRCQTTLESGEEDV